MSKRAGIQLCYPFEEKRLKKWEAPYILQPKLDGERCRALISGGNVTLLSSEMNEISSVPHINSAIRALHLGDKTELDGELYIHGAPFEEIHSIVSRTTNFHPSFQRMQFHIFDYIQEGNLEAIQGHRIIELRKLKLLHPLQTVPSHTVYNLEDIMTWYNHYLDQDYEGIILRNIFFPYERKRSTGAMKFKPKKTDHYQIVGCLEAIDKHGEPKNTLGAFQCVGMDGTIFQVGAGCLSHKERKYIWDNQDSYHNLACEVQYQNITSNGIPRFGLCFKPPKEVWNDEVSPIEMFNIKR